LGRIARLIVIDTSALMAIVFRQRLGRASAIALDEAESIAISAGTLSEIFVVASRHKALDVTDSLLDSFPLDIHAVDEAEARRVGSAFRRWGRGSDNYCLNWGDCFAYALASRLACPLLFIGNDFSRTDIRSVLENPDPNQP
jgi:ribonuclease VapC